MKCYFQIEIEQAGQPKPNRYRRARKLSAAKEEFESGAQSLKGVLGFYENSLLDSAKLLVWRGNPEGDKPCANEPDMVFGLGPKGGVVRER